jgi:bifunctional UDP-N-acetylglucosamine pyrophosphorylase/glucosamine-1-phosphate N-acetyltransferase
MTPTTGTALGGWQHGARSFLIYMELNPMKIFAVILAAGQGTRMRSNLPKVLHPLVGRPMAWHALETARIVTCLSPVMVIGHGADAVRQTLGEQAAEYVVQSPRLGTGHAVQQAESVLSGQADLVLVTYADMPLVTAETLRRLVQAHQTQTGPITMLTVVASDPRGFGRIVRDTAGHVQAIIEEAQATPAQLAIRELNASVYCFSADWLWPALHRIPLSPKGEYYLTDLIGLAVADGMPVQALVAEDPSELIGINTRVHLAEAEAILRKRINQEWMLQGVTLVNPDATYIEPGVKIGSDTVIWPNTYLQGETQIGLGCELGPSTIIHDSRIGDQCTILFSVLEGACLEDQVKVGPFARLRKGAHLAQGVHMGNFGEVKDSYLGPGVKMGHFSYLGDATIGSEVNIGAGTITCNFDGAHKHPTVVGAGAFIGSDTMLVAPVKIGEGARTGAGAVVTRDVPPFSLAVGMPARTIRKLEHPE